MKKTIWMAFAALMLAAPVANAQKVNESAFRSKIEKSNAAIADANSHYDAAQSLCDKLVNDQEFFSSLNTDELCRLALLFVRLAENYGDENANTAFASKTLDAAI